MPVISHWWNFEHGARAFLWAYLLVQVPMVVAMIRSRAPFSKFIDSPALALPIMLVQGLVMTLLVGLLHPLGVTDHNWVLIVWDAGVLVALGYAGGEVLAEQDPRGVHVHRRGAVVSNRRPAGRSRLWGRTANGGRASDPAVTLAGMRVAAEDETKHFKLVGTTGTGKSTAIRELLQAALARGDRAIIADPDGGYMKHFYDAGRGDVILNPFAAESKKWNLLAEIRNDYDVDQLARSLIPDGASDKIWSAYARTFFTAVTQQVIKGGIRDDAELYRLVIEAPSKELRMLLAGTAAGPFLEEANDRMFGSVRSVASSALYVLKYTTKQQAPVLSVRQWVSRGKARHLGGQGGVLFLPYKAGEIAALRSVISAWMRIAIFEALDQGEGDQRLWFVVDELDALGEIDGLKDALARLRKFGGRCVLGFQSISQVSTTYGKGTADTIVENCGNTLILRCSASESGGTSQFASRLIGQREVVHTTRSRTSRSTGWLGSTTTSEDRIIEPAIMASEIERLPDLEGYLKVASDPDWIRVRLSPPRSPPAQRSPPPAASGITPVAPPATLHPTAAAPLDKP